MEEIINELSEFPWIRLLPVVLIIMTVKIVSDLANRGMNSRFNSLGQLAVQLVIFLITTIALFWFYNPGDFSFFSELDVDIGGL